MIYKNAETYLNEQIRKPIKNELKGVDDKKVAKVMEIVDFLCDKYREMNATALFYDKKIDYSPELFKEYQKFMKENGYYKSVDYDSLENEEEEFFDEVLGEIK